MKKITIKLVLLILIASNLFAGGGNRNGTAGAAQLLIPVGARGIAMGGATLSSSTGIESLFWNPANISRGESSTNVYFSQMSHIADIGVTYGAVSTNIEGIGTLALNIKSLDIGDIPITTLSNPDGTGANFTPTFMTVGLTYSRMLSDRISVGVTANYISETIDLVSATGIAFNVGLSYTNLANINGLSFGMVIKNLGPQMKYDGSGLYVKAEESASTGQDPQRGSQYYKLEAATYELPSTLELGFGYQYSINQSNAVLLNGVFQNSNFYGDEYKVGLEYQFNNWLFLRGGYSYMPELEKDYNIYGLTAGMGLTYTLGGVHVKFEYAYRDAQYFNGNHIFAIQLGL